MKVTLTKELETLVKEKAKSAIRWCEVASGLEKGKNGSIGSFPTMR